MFRWPFSRPPRNSFFQRGSPANLSFRTTDHGRLQMEARQKLGEPLSARCCGRLQVVIQNADLHPGTVRLEALLIDGGQPAGVEQSLGLAPVQSVTNPTGDRAEPVLETLHFRFPSSPHIEQFDEIRVIFHRASGRMDRSARVSIERFVLVPPG
jgi:hypothetical protein